MSNLKFGIRELQKSLFTPYNQIMKYLYLGNKISGTDKKILKDLNIKRIVQVTVDEEPYFKDDYLYHIIAVGDAPDANISKFFDKAIRFIDEGINNKENTLVHCAAGASRSASIVIAYVMYLNQCDFEKAFTIVRTQRIIVDPNDGFKKQLKNYKPPKIFTQPKKEILNT